MEADERLRDVVVLILFCISCYDLAIYNVTGKFRPLQKLVDSNNSKDVISLSTIALKHLSDSRWEKAITSITALKGIGVATASAIFAPFRPDLVPFMADEVIDSTCSGKRDYNMKVYKRLRDSCIAKAKVLGHSWDAEMVGKALWVRAMVSKHASYTMAVLDSAASDASNEDGSIKDASVPEPEDSDKGSGTITSSNHTIDASTASITSSTFIDDNGSTTTSQLKRKRTS